MLTTNTNNYGSIMTFLQRRKLLIGVTLLILISTIMLVTCKGSEKTQAAAPQEKKRIKIVVEQVAPRPLRDLLLLPGETEAIHDIKLAADHGGRVEFVGVKEGDTVKAGQVIARIGMQTLSANLDKAQAASKQADDLAARRVDLYKQELISKEELDQINTEKNVARGSLKEAQASFRQGLVLAPVTGIINKLHVDPGEVVSPGDPVADLVNVDSIRINVNVPELDVRYLTKGRKVPIAVDAYPGEHWAGEVEFVAFKADPTTKTFLVRVEIKNKDHRIRPGMLARVVFERQIIKDAITAPLFAILDKGGERLLFVEEKGVARSRNISLGVIEGDRIQILQGLKPGENLIVSGQTEVEDGAEVLAQ